EYFTNPNRGYGRGTIAVLTKLRQTKASDPLKPAQESFGGIGSQGNGAAMRIAPVALFCYNKSDKLQDMVRQCSLVTHSNDLSVNGAILQALAIHYCVNENPEDFKNEELLEYLCTEFEKIEGTLDEFGLATEKVYGKKLEDVKKLLLKEDPSIDELMNKLGNNATALGSVPTALYCFLKAHKQPIKGIDMKLIKKLQKYFIKDQTSWDNITLTSEVTFNNNVDA
uniref:ADP-ribosylhydrolase ARH3 n=1 Tax=Megaselia scalaris TaxID=36166 RepID=T1GD60_MEGSC